MAVKTVFYPEMIAFGGGERIVLALSKHLYCRTIPHELVLYYLSVDLQSHAEWPVPIRQLNPSRNPLMKVRSLRNYLAGRQAAGSGTALLVGIQAALHAGVLGTRDYVLMILDTPSLMRSLQSPTSGLGRMKRSLRSSARYPILRRGMRRAKMVIATSKYMAEEMRRRYGVYSVIVRQAGLSPRRNGTNNILNGHHDFRMLSVSRLEPNKRIDWILQALARPEVAPGVSLANVPWHLDVVGDGSERYKLQQQASRLGLGSIVTFHGHVSDARLEELYGGASLFLMPAFQGYGLPALEALSRRVPVVMHRESGVSEILDGTPWVELVEGSIDSLKLGLARMLERVQSNRLASAPLPEFPSEPEWANQVCRICGWS